jgi:hypothetical protein
MDTTTTAEGDAVAPNRNDVPKPHNSSPRLSTVSAGFDAPGHFERSHMDRATSKDGTSIAYERLGNGPALILVGGGLDDGSENAPLAAELAQSFAVYNYARRGQGDSGDTLPYAVEREIEAQIRAMRGAEATLELLILPFRS